MFIVFQESAKLRWCEHVNGEISVVAKLFLLRVVLLLESGGNCRLGLKKLGDWAGMSFGYFGVLSSMLGRW